jgi:hypothetical protein
MNPPKNDKEYKELADEMIEWFKEKDNIFLKNFSVMKGFPATSISKYARKNKYFKEKLSLAKDIQEGKLVQRGLKKEVNSNFAIFMLKNTAGWRDRFADEKEEKNIPSIKLVLKESKSEKKNRKRKENKDQINMFDNDEKTE